MLSPFNPYMDSFILIQISAVKHFFLQALFHQFLLTDHFSEPLKNQRFRNNCVKNQINKKRKRLTPFGRRRLHLASDVRITHTRGKRET